MAEVNTFFKIYRSLFDHWIWNVKPYDELHAWIWIIGHANYADSKRLYNGYLQEVSRGQIVTSETALAAEWGWSRRKVHNFLNILENDKMLVVKRTAKGTTLTVENYDKFQNVRTAEAPQKHSSSTAEAPLKHSSRTHNKNNKESKERKEGEERAPTRATPSAPPPSPEPNRTEEKLSPEENARLAHEARMRLNGMFPSNRR